MSAESSTAAPTPPPSTTAADALGRLRSGSARGGRGAVVGWTLCPLCNNNNSNNNRFFARGRGLAAHLHAIHAPWKASSVAMRKKCKPKRLSKKERRRFVLRQEQQQDGQVEATQIQQQQQSTTATTLEACTTDASTINSSTGWDPTAAERQAWDARVLEIVARVEQQAAERHDEREPHTAIGITRTGQAATSYKASLPPFHQAAASGHVPALQRLVQRHGASALLRLRDRHGSTAESWAAGEGHLSALQYLVQARRQVQQQQSACTTTEVQPKKMRRRDGKTPLHYAARNGRVECAQYLLQEQPDADVDVRSGDGTTPLHLACFGGHLGMVQYLVDTAGANVHATNVWQCTVAHWVAMCQRGKSKNDTDKNGNSNNHKQERDQELWQLCDWLHTQHGVQFHVAQSQGHSALHKAAQHQNFTVLQWMAQNLDQAQKYEAAQPDQGGHTPWDILQAVRGDPVSAAWLRKEFLGDDTIDGSAAQTPSAVVANQAKDTKSDINLTTE